MDSYFFNTQGVFQPALFNEYQRIKNAMIRDLNSYIKPETAYMEENQPIMMDIINTPQFYNILRPFFVETTKENFQKNIPNPNVGLAYVNLYSDDVMLYMNYFEDDGMTTFMMVREDKLLMFFEVRL